MTSPEGHRENQVLGASGRRGGGGKWKGRGRLSRRGEHSRRQEKLSSNNCILSYISQYCTIIIFDN